MKTTIDFNEHLDAQARAYEIGKAEGSAQAAQVTTRPCCGDFEECPNACVPKADHFKRQRDRLVVAFNETAFREMHQTRSTDCGVAPADIHRIAAICKEIKRGQPS